MPQDNRTTHKEAAYRKATWLAALLVGALGLARVGAQPAPPAEAEITYGTPAFRALVQESYDVTAGAPQTPRPEQFGAWWQDTYARTPGAQLPQHTGLGWPDAVAARRAALAAQRDPEKRAQLERETAAWLHHAVKTMIPKFSLERGFEFANTVKLGERQCLLQSVLIAGILQELGLHAGVAMVWKNERGQESNLGHVVTVLRLSGGHDVLVDASDSTPFMRHQGLLLREASAQGQAYRFMRPQYAADNSVTGYEAEGHLLAPAEVLLLDGAYVRSQFAYYRGERAPGGFMGKSTPAGLTESARFMQQAVKLSPDNALAAQVLGHIYRKQGNKGEAARQYQAAYRLYQAEGHLPGGVAQTYAWAQDTLGGKRAQR